MKISKEFQFDAGHRLTFHQGKCYNVHGHRYKVIVELEGEVNPNGLVKDFSDLSRIKEWLDSNRDHGYVYNSKDEVGQFLKEKGFKVFDFGDFEPTAENMSAFLYGLFHQKEPMVKSVTVRETPTAYATFIGND